jgi:hypothetical protein
MGVKFFELIAGNALVSYCPFSSSSNISWLESSCFTSITNDESFMIHLLTIFVVSENNLPLIRIYGWKFSWSLGLLAGNFLSWCRSTVSYSN